jgi:hypothetical protein
MLLRKLLSLKIVHKSERRDRTRLEAQASFHSLRGGERQFALSQHMLQRMDIEGFMALEDHKVMTVSLMVAEEKVLAMYRIDVLPILKSQFYGRKRRMGIKFILKSVSFQEVQNFVYSIVSRHRLRLLA